MAMFEFKDPITAGINLATGVIDRFMPNKTEAAKAKFELIRLQQTGKLNSIAAFADLEKAQVRVNEIEAASDKFWKYGWRPFVGWACGAGFAYTYVVQPFLIFIMTMAGAGDRVSELPLLDIGEMTPVLMGMLGLGWLRTKEKMGGVKAMNP